MSLMSWLRSRVLGHSLTKSSITQPLVFAQYPGNSMYGVPMQRDAKQYAHDAFKRCPVGYRAVQMVARACAAVPIEVIAADDTVLEEHPIVDLLERPNPMQAWPQFCEAMVSYLLLSGNSFIEGVSPTDGAPYAEMWVHRPDRVKVRNGEAGVIGYIYECAGQTREWEADPSTGRSDLKHIKFFHPLDDWYGLSPVEAAANSVDSHNLASAWNQSLLQNGAKPDGLLLYRPGETQAASLSEAQRNSLREQFDSMYAGSRNAGRVPILEGGVEYTPVGRSPAEMEWLEGKRENAREIALVYGVPPMLLGIPGDNTYSNQKEARQAFHEDTVLPLLRFCLNEMSHWLADQLDGARLCADTSDLPAFAQQRADTWNAVQNATWLTINEKREAVGMPRLEKPEADEVFINSGLMPLTGSTAEPELDETPPAATPPGQPPVAAKPDENDDEIGGTEDEA